MTTVFITFASGSPDTYNLTNGFGATDPTTGAGPSNVALIDGNFFLKIDGSQMTDSMGQEVDAGGTGNFGSAASDEFFRLFGDYDGNRTVDYYDQSYFAQGYNKPANYSEFAYFDYDGDGLINSSDFTQFSARRGTTLNP